MPEPIADESSSQLIARLLGHVQEGPGYDNLDGAVREAMAAEAARNAAYPQLLAVARRVVAASLAPGSRHQYADGKASLAGCSLTVEDIEAALRAVATVHGVDEESALRAFAAAQAARPR